jgi:hypothetical protein
MASRRDVESGYLLEELPAAEGRLGEPSPENRGPRSGDNPEAHVVQEGHTYKWPEGPEELGRTTRFDRLVSIAEWILVLSPTVFIGMHIFHHDNLFLPSCSPR